MVEEQKFPEWNYDHPFGTALEREVHLLPQDMMLALGYLRNKRGRVWSTKKPWLACFEGEGRCLARGDKVLMADGSWKNIEDIKCGDFVFSPQHDKTTIPAKVLSTHSHFEEDTYDVIEIKKPNRRLYTCSKDHKIPLLARYYPRIKQQGKEDCRPCLRRYREYTAEHVSKIKRALNSDVVAFTTGPIDFGKVDSTAKPHALGLWLGDGHCVITRHSRPSSISRQGMTVDSYSVGITTNNDEIVESFDADYPGEKTRTSHKQGTTAVQIGITTKPTGVFFSELKRLGLAGKKSGDKFIPSECMLSSVQYRMRLLGGIIDTDGFVPKKNGVLEVVSKSKRLANDVLDLVHSLGGHGDITKQKKGIKSIGFVGEYYCARFAFKSTNLVPLIDSMSVKMKKERLAAIIKRYRNTTKPHINYDPCNVGIKCIRAAPQMVYGITLESPSELFITNNWLVTHNSGKSYTACLFATILDRTFYDDMENRVVHGHQAFIDKVKEMDAKKIRGGVIICDEAGVVGNFSSAEWQKEWMAAINSVMQMFGYLRLIVLFIAPDKSFIDSKTRKMFHTLHKVSRTNTQCAIVKPYVLRWNQYKKRYDEVSQVIRIGNSRIKLKRIFIKHYPKELGERYRAIEQSRKPDMLQDLGRRAVASKVQHARKTFDNEALADEIYKNPTAYETRRSKSRAPGDPLIIDHVLVRVKFGVPVDNAKYIKSLVETRDEKERAAHPQPHPIQSPPPAVIEQPKRKRGRPLKIGGT